MIYMSKTATTTTKPNVTAEEKAAAKAEKDAAKLDASAANADGAEKASKSKKDSDVIYYVVYVNTYIDDEQILPRGIYKTNQSFDRLDNSKPMYVRKFVGEIPDKVVHEIATTLKISITDVKGNYRKTEDILAEVATDL